MKSANTNLCALESGGGMSAVMVKTWQRTFWFFFGAYILGHQKLGYIYLPFKFWNRKMFEQGLYLRSKHLFSKKSNAFFDPTCSSSCLVEVGSRMVAVQGIEKYMHR